MDDTIDFLQIKIEKARSELPEVTRRAIDAVDWKSVILGMKDSKGYTIDQLGDLELETELLLCGLLDPKDYPHELEMRMNLPRSKVDQLVTEMNQSVFGKIREELVRQNTRKEIFDAHKREPAPVAAQTPVKKVVEIPRSETVPKEEEILSKAGIKIVEPQTPKPYTRTIPTAKADLTIPELSSGPLAQKLGGSFQAPKVVTNHKLENLTPQPASTSYPKGADPYRMAPE